MGQKDIAEKTLEAYNDVFADIVSVLLFNNKRRIRPNELLDTKERSQYKADGGLHEMERDVSKIWKKAQFRLALIGIENETRYDATMPVRTIGYDGNAYRSQLLNGQKKIYPVVTIVLYFGTEKWKNKRLYDCFTVPKELQPYVNDYHINLFEIPKLKKSQVDMFQSDFKIVADYFVQKAKGDYKPSKEKIKHVDEVLKLLRVMSNDDRFIQEFTPQERKRGVTMDTIITKFETQGYERGVQQGVQQGEKRGELNILFRQVNDGILNKKLAAQYAGITPQTFGRKMKEAGYK